MKEIYTLSIYNSAQSIFQIINKKMGLIFTIKTIKCQIKSDVPGKSEVRRQDMMMTKSAKLEFVCEDAG